MRLLREALAVLEHNSGQNDERLVGLRKVARTRVRKVLRMGLGTTRRLYKARREELRRRLHELAARKSPLHTLRSIVHL